MHSRYATVYRRLFLRPLNAQGFYILVQLLTGRRKDMQLEQHLDGSDLDVKNLILRIAETCKTIKSGFVTRQACSDTENVYGEKQMALDKWADDVLINDLKASGLVRYLASEEQPDIFSLYEQNIGMLTPMIAEELREAERLYPETWIKDAIKEAVSLNKRNWRYIAKILENWSAGGRSNGTYRRDSTKKTGSDKYIKGKYGHMVGR